MENQEDEYNIFQKIGNGVKDMWHGLTDNPQQLSRYQRNRQYQGALDAQNNGEALNSRQRSTLNRGNAALERQRNTARRSADRSMSKILRAKEDGRGNYYDTWHREKPMYDASLDRLSRLNKSKSPY